MCPLLVHDGGARGGKERANTTENKKAVMVDRGGRNSGRGENRFAQCTGSVGWRRRPLKTTQGPDGESVRPFR